MPSQNCIPRFVSTKGVNNLNQITMKLRKSITIELDDWAIRQLSRTTGIIMEYDELNGMQRALIQLFQNDIKKRKHYEINSYSADLIEVLKMLKEEDARLTEFIKLIESEI